jgi:ribosomal protein S1
MGTVTTLRYAADTKSRDSGPMIQSAEGGGVPDMTDKTPKAEQLKKSAEGAMAPQDLREETLTESSKQQQHAKADTSMAKECRDCVIVRGRVLKVENDYLTVRDRSKREVRLHMDKTTMIGQRNIKDEPFKEGDRVEAYVTSEGHAHSVSLIRTQGGIPGDPDAGG